MAKILVAEDDTELCKLIEDWLALEQHNVEVVGTGTDALDRLRFYQYDAMVLDWELPQMSGIDVLRQFRQRGGMTPVLMLTGKKAMEEKELGLDSGADDYLTKPFPMRELSARLRALMRRPATYHSEQLTLGDLTLDSAEFKVTRRGKEVKLAPTEFSLLQFLMRNANIYFSADAIINRLWPNDSDVSPDAVRIYINRLRTKLDIPGEPSLINTQRGVGYKLDVS